MRCCAQICQNDNDGGDEEEEEDEDESEYEEYHQTQSIYNLPIPPNMSARAARNRRTTQSYVCSTY